MNNKIVQKIFQNGYSNPFNQKMKMMGTVFCILTLSTGFKLIQLIHEDPDKIRLCLLFINISW
jgi:hypothetical protein